MCQAFYCCLYARVRYACARASGPGPPRLGGSVLPRTTSQIITCHYRSFAVHQFDSTALRARFGPQFVFIMASAYEKLCEELSL